MRTISHWIDGRPASGSTSRTAPVYNPATGEVQAEVLLAGAADVEAAVRCAADRFRSWSQSSLSARTEILFAFRNLVHSQKQQLAGIISDEHGKVLSDAAGEVQRGLEVIEFACGIPTLLTTIVERRATKSAASQGDRVHKHARPRSGPAR